MRSPAGLSYAPGLLGRWGWRPNMHRVLIVVTATALATAATLSLGTTARAELVAGGWLTPPRLPDPPPEATAPPEPAAIRPLPPPRPKVSRPAVQRPPARPPSDGKVQF
jgi:hypothetical protein